MTGTIDPLFPNHPDNLARQKDAQDFIENFTRDIYPRPAGSNADEWHLFLSQYIDNRANFPTGMTFIAVQVAEAIEAARLAAKPADEVDFSFDLRETLRAVLEFWGVDGAAKVTRHVMLARRSRDSNAEIDALEEIFGPLTTGEPKR